LESIETIWSRVKPALEFFPPERLILTSECGFGHVPLPITRAKLSRLVEACQAFRTRL
jgi:5-methyltetrahydropteroyltriglutamate--homocysteine methyltransferase